ncbi:MAG: hypothetical protein GXW96_05740, partial [Christensenellaceae bacterium]|nr:hypothetical protein [Christensenellaceae bacterium]
MNTQNLQPIYIATVTEVVEGGVKLHFRGELAPRTKVYSVIGATPSVNDRVAVAAVSGTYVVLGGGAGGSGGFDPADFWRFSDIPYETGTWTPTLKGLGNGVSATITTHSCK